MGGGRPACPPRLGMGAGLAVWRVCPASNKSPSEMCCRGQNTESLASPASSSRLEGQQMRCSGDWRREWGREGGVRQVTGGFRGRMSMSQRVFVVAARLGSRGGVPGQFAAAVCSCLENGTGS